MFQQAIERSEANDEVRLRVNALIDTITYSVFLYTTRGLFEKDKLIFAAQMTFQVSHARRCAAVKFSIHVPIYYIHSFCFSFILIPSFMKYDECLICDLARHCTVLFIHYYWFYLVVMLLHMQYCEHVSSGSLQPFTFMTPYSLSLFLLLLISAFPRK